MRIHATLVSVGGRGLLIRGASGRGKSQLALEMIALGAELVADDSVIIADEGGRLIGRCPPVGQGMIEARGLGVLCLPSQSAARIVAVADLDTPEPERLPPWRSETLCNRSIRLIWTPPQGHSAAALLLMLRHDTGLSPPDPLAQAR